MKPLNEIGKRICLTSARFTDTVTACRSNCKPGTVYTDEERRELVREVVRLVIKELTGELPSDERVEYEFNIIFKGSGI